VVKNDYNYRKSIEEIEVILEKIERGETDIDNLSAEIKRATKLLHECKQKLFQTEKKMEKVLQSDE
jgi:exodeoxyribonuclease VII small subunit